MHTRLAVYNILGQEVTLLVDERLPAGQHFRRWNAEGRASGIYILSLQAGNEMQVKRVLLIR